MSNFNAAAKSLADDLVKYPWFVTVGLWQKMGEKEFYVYARSVEEARKVLPPGYTWEGFVVSVRKMGTPKPANVEMLEDDSEQSSGNAETQGRQDGRPAEEGH